MVSYLSAYTDVFGKALYKKNTKKVVRIILLYCDSVILNRVHDIYYLHFKSVKNREKKKKSILLLRIKPPLLGF